MRLGSSLLPALEGGAAGRSVAEGVVGEVVVITVVVLCS